MQQLEIVKKAMHLMPGSFINHNNEFIMIPKFNVYTLLDDVQTEDDFKVKLCEWFSRDCCCALRYSQAKRLDRYHRGNLAIFNMLCETSFDIADIGVVYTKLGNGIRHKLCMEFVQSGFDLKLLEENK